MENLSFASRDDKVNFGVSRPKEKPAKETVSLARVALEEINRGDYR